jgi:hypothetical protein
MAYRSLYIAKVKVDHYDTEFEEYIRIIHPIIKDRTECFDDHFPCQKKM